MVGEVADVKEAGRRNIEHRGYDAPKHSAARSLRHAWQSGSRQPDSDSNADREQRPPNTLKEHALRHFNGAPFGDKLMLLDAFRDPSSARTGRRAQDAA